MKFIKDLSNENVIHILSYLRATDLASAREVDKTVFSELRISHAIDLLLEEVYVLQTPSSTKPQKGPIAIGVPFTMFTKRPDYLFVKEISQILLALTSP